MSNVIFCADNMDNLCLIRAEVQFVTLQCHVYKSLYIVYTTAIHMYSPMPSVKFERWNKKKFWHKITSFKVKAFILLSKDFFIFVILIHYVCNGHFHWLWRRKFVALKSLRLCHESSDYVMSLATRRSNIKKMFWNCVLSEWIRMVITRFMFEWFAGINCIILRSQIPILPLRWRVAVKLNLGP